MTGSKREMNGARPVDSCMIAMGLSVPVTGKADCVGKFDAKALNGRMAQRGHGLHLVVRSGFCFPQMSSVWKAAGDDTMLLSDGC